MGARGGEGEGGGKGVGEVEGGRRRRGRGGGRRRRERRRRRPPPPHTPDRRGVPKLFREPRNPVREFEREVVEI